MPVKWTAELDQLLLVLVLRYAQNNGLKITDAVIHEMWPADHPQQPTKKALTLHLGALRNTNRELVSSTPVKRTSGTDSTTTTPAKKTKVTPKGKTPSKLVDSDDDENEIKSESDGDVKPVIKDEARKEEQTTIQLGGASEDEADD